MQPDLADIVQWTRDQILKSGCSGFVIGVSGGIDSAVCAAIGHRTGLPGKYLFLDCESDPADLTVAKLVATRIGFDLETLDLKSVYREFLSVMGRGCDDMARANLKPRLRMTALYNVANRSESLVIGTSNLPERMIGYFTKWGDGAADIIPLGNMVKREVYALGQNLDLPEEVLTRPPSAGLWPGQTDEEEIGISYRDLDALFRSESVPDDITVKIKRLIVASEHKRSLPVIYPGPGGWTGGSS